MLKFSIFTVSPISTWIQTGFSRCTNNNHCNIISLTCGIHCRKYANPTSIIRQWLTVTVGKDFVTDDVASFVRKVYSPQKRHLKLCAVKIDFSSGRVTCSMRLLWCTSSFSLVWFSQHALTNLSWKQPQNTRRKHTKGPPQKYQKKDKPIPMLVPVLLG